MKNSTTPLYRFVVLALLVYIAVFISLTYTELRQDEADRPPAASDSPNESDSSSNKDDLPPGSDTRADVSVDDDAVLGDDNAPVTIIEFSDYECPFCAKYFSETFPKIKTEYVDTGKVKIVFRDFPLDFHENAITAAVAAECAGDRGKYWQMHDLIFENQEAISSDDLKNYAAQINDLDIASFNSCLDSLQHEDEVKADLAAGSEAGVEGTPAFFINGRLVSGAQPYSVFQQIIDEELAK